MFRFPTSQEKEEFLKDRAQDRLEFRKRCGYTFLPFGVVWIISQVISSNEGQPIPKNLLITGICLIIGILLIILIITRVKFVVEFMKRASYLVHDTMFFCFFILIAFVGGAIMIHKYISILDTSGTIGFFSAANLWIPMILLSINVKCFGINWIHKIVFLACCLLGFLGLKCKYSPVASEIFLEASSALLILAIIVIEEWTFRINFANKKISREKNELFEAVLERIQETIAVFDSKMNLKYSNTAKEPVSFVIPTERSLLPYNPSTSSLESLANSIKNLRFLERKHSSNEALRIKNHISAFDSRELSLFDFIKQIRDNAILYQEFVEQKFINLEGKISRNIEINSLDESDQSMDDQFFTIQVFAKSFERENCFVIILKDISEHLTMMQERNEIQSNLLSSLSHELNTPLGISQTLVENAIKDSQSSSYINNLYLEPALNYTRMLKYFVNDVLDFVKMQKNDFRINLDFACVESCLAEVSSLVLSSINKKGLTLEFEYDRSKRTVIKTDPLRLKQVVLNLLANAIKYTMRGVIKLRMNLTEDKKACLIKVSDTGIGINTGGLDILRKKLEKINFCTLVNKNSTGAGIGLIISNAITKCLNPTKKCGLQIESQPEKGSTFTLELENVGSEGDEISEDMREVSLEYQEISEPLKLPLPTSPIPRNCLSFISTQRSLIRFSEIRLAYENFNQNLNIPAKTDYLCRCKKILAVDDEVFNTVAVEMISKSHGYSTDTAFNGMHALDMIERRMKDSCGSNCKIYDLIIMDCNMPIMDGYVATQKIREKIQQGVWKDLIIGGCTAYEGSEKLDKCLKVGMNTYVRKPLDKSKFQQLLKNYRIGDYEKRITLS